ncbi:uncharacterized protein EDB93DRAFT_1239132 [Suillus bovinus]|uniref:uncharacterized protein n=1 Tax=Suillus bovinus TaxID=48563 RepID=UPI001B86DCE8|nr:uncharacterized protein EDB93DRAFT_1239132 [Suillus bovinus]KAG2156018.1 hypothetical protein EDB93DRAFT_1239132 [Suillus bovinus]
MASHAPVPLALSLLSVAPSPPIVDEEPWQPFSCHADFEFAELAHNAALNKDHTDALLQLVWRIVDGQANITFKSHHDVSVAWDRAAGQMTPFEKHTITTKHKREDLMFDVYTCPLWDWALDLLQDPFLVLHFIWDAQWVYKHDGTCYKHFYHKPWTVDRWWNVQSSLPENAVPFAFILYADKTHLSSTGTVKAYLVFTHCGNLPIHIRNTDRFGGGQMVSWLPIVPEDSEEDSKLLYMNLKHVVWHEGFFKLLKTIILHAKTGYTHLCYDGIVRWLYVFILLLSADYEEQYVMALIRGTNCHCPCPICLVPSDKLYDNASTYPIQTPEDTQACIELWNQNKTAGEEALKKRGLWPVMNVFWRLPNSNPHKMILQDHLHMYHLGEWGKHLFAALGRGAEKKIDDHDGFEYITIINETDPDAIKNWNFPKMHASKHIFDDIIAKGAAHNFSTRPNEKQHGPIRHWYLWQTNRKDIANQIVVLSHKSFVSEFIRSCINYLDEEQHKLTLSWEELKEDNNNNKLFEAYLHTSSPLRSLTSLAQVEEEHRSNRAFDHFRKKLMTFLNHFLPSHHIPLPDGVMRLKLPVQDLIHEHRYLKHIVGNCTLDLALVLPMDASPYLQLTHLHARPAASSEFITLHSIIRGALLVPDFDNNGDYFLVDYTDTDMFLRIQRKLI